jgi:ferredoxin
LIRACIAGADLALFCCAYLWPGIDSNGILAPLVKTQFSATLYGTGVLGLAVICNIALALIAGRVYCSVLCPLGTLQELIWRAGQFRGRKRRAGYISPPQWRYLILPALGLGLAFSFTPLMLILDPISTFGRGMGALCALWGGTATPFALTIAFPLVLILIIAFFRGRAFCDWCPVGQTLGLLASLAPFGMKIASRCVSCGICETKCPVHCINAREKRLDRERCVLCFSCAPACPAGAATFGIRKFNRELQEGRGQGAPVSRRVFLRGAVSVFCGGAYLLGPSLKTLSRTGSADRSGALILPPGAHNVKSYLARCVSCHACAAACPVGVLRPAYSSHPVLDFSIAACQYSCVECGKVCPSSAIRRLSVEEKQRTRIALSSLDFTYCVVKTKKESCGACAEVCPTHALRMEPYDEPGIPFLTKPVFDEQYCVGCGACLVTCPAQPKAFVVRAAAEQTLTPGMRPTEGNGGGFLYQAGDDFPF